MTAEKHPLDDAIQLVSLAPTEEGLPTIQYVYTMFWYGAEVARFGGFYYHISFLKDALRKLVEISNDILVVAGTKDIWNKYRQEYNRAALKHPGRTLDADTPTDEERSYAILEEIGEVAASLTYDAKQETGHNVELIKETTQVGALALAWLARILKEDHSES